ncbi:MAG TPA: hypothetical protein DD381_00500 [Lentisphaeria bacterium]|nr:MAG: hypothetical protein A2X47_05035 [Lentisphaerae bacterium GWF2_38_69]HBM14822.1 hypothetical protein [Lentisphaeria bacterium]
MIEVKEVKNKKDIKAFVEFPLELYEGNEYFVPPILRDEINTLRKDKNPCFEFCEAKYWMASRDGKTVGRIAGILNHGANEAWNHKRMRFGWVDFIDDIEVTRELFKQVENWARETGMTHIEGPMGFCDIDKEGMLVEGFEELSLMSSYYNYPYYIRHMEQLGYVKDVDWVEYTGTNLDFPQEMNRLFQISKKRLRGYSPVPIDTHKDINKYKSEIVTLLNRAFKPIHGYVPINERIFDHYFKELFYYTNLDYVSLVKDPDGKIVGFGLAMPILSKAVKASNGKLFPTGYFTIKKAFKKNDSIVMILVAVYPELQSKGIPLLIIDNVNSKLLKNGITHVETSHMLEDNEAVLELWRHFKTRKQHKRRRSFIKPVF